MTLIDPPEYCALPPALIYDADDLERENYKALLQLAGWMWVCRRRRTALRTSVPELAARWGIGTGAVYTRLRILARLGYLVISYNPNSSVDITLGPRALHRGDNYTPGEPANNTPGEPGDNTPGEPADNTPGELGDNTPGEPAHITQGEPGLRANSLHENQASCKQFARKPHTTNDLVVVVVDPDPDRSKQQQQTISTALRENGVFGDIADRLAADPWITVERIAAWVANLAANPRIKNLGAVLAANLRAHWDPPAAVAESNRTRNSKYICAVCWQRPCVCEE